MVQHRRDRTEHGHLLRLQLGVDVAFVVFDPGLPLAATHGVGDGLTVMDRSADSSRLFGVSACARCSPAQANLLQETLQARIFPILSSATSAAQALSQPALPAAWFSSVSLEKLDVESTLRLRIEVCSPHYHREYRPPSCCWTLPSG